jgi:hypothetical protein
LGNHDAAGLKEDLKKLMTTVVEFNYLMSRDKQKWEATTILADAKFGDDNKLYYSFSPMMPAKLNNLELYARINLSIQKNINSKAALILYELAKDHFISNHGKGQTPWISVEDLKRLMDCNNDKSYQTFKEFNRTILKKALKEIEDKTEIVVKPRLKIRKKICEAVKFDIRAKADKSSMINEVLGEKQPELTMEGNEIYQILVNEHKLSPSQAQDVINKCSEDFIRKQIAYVVKYTSRPDFKGNHSAYLYSAFMRGGYEDTKLLPPPKPDLPKIETGMRIDIGGGEIYTIDENGNISTDDKHAIPKNTVRQRLADGMFKVVTE